MVSTCARYAAGDVDVSAADFADIDALFDGHRPLTVAFNTYVPGAERLYAVEMAAGEALGALQMRQHRREGGGEEDGGDEGDGDEDGEGEDGSAEFFTSIFEEPARTLDDNPAVVWREEPSTLFVGDPGSATVVHHDIIGQIELCHVLSGAKLLAAAPWGDSSRQLLANAAGGGAGGGGGGGGGKSGGEEQHGAVDDVDDDDEEEEEEEEEEEGSMLSVPVHRKLYDAEKTLLHHPGLSVVHARPGDAVAFSSAATHFATNGVGNGPCAAVFHGVLTPASAHVLASHPGRLDPFTDEERESEGFGGHLTGRMVLQELLPAGTQVLKATAAAEAKAKTRAAKEAKAAAKEAAKAAKAAAKEAGVGDGTSSSKAAKSWKGKESSSPLSDVGSSPLIGDATAAALPRFTVNERGAAGEAAARRRFEEAVRRMDAAVKATKAKKKKPKKNGKTPPDAPPDWPGVLSTSFYVHDEAGDVSP